VAGIELTSMGQVTAQSEADEELISSDSGAGTYKKIVIRENRVVGAILLGDASAGRMIREFWTTGRDVSDARSTLLGGQAGETAPVGAMDLPDTALVCNCNSVTKGEIVAAIREKGCASRQDIAECTRATTGCGTCAGLVDGCWSPAPAPANGRPGGEGDQQIEKLKKARFGRAARSLPLRQGLGGDHRGRRPAARGTGCSCVRPRRATSCSASA
jgi:bacterioferritin-associated ferredoxin